MDEKLKAALDRLESRMYLHDDHHMLGAFTVGDLKTVIAGVKALSQAAQHMSDTMLTQQKETENEKGPFAEN